MVLNCRCTLSPNQSAPVAPATARATAARDLPTPGAPPSTKGLPRSRWKSPTSFEPSGTGTAFICEGERNSTITRGSGFTGPAIVRLSVRSPLEDSADKFTITVSGSSASGS